jgi:hypothetical protein
MRDPSTKEEAMKYLLFIQHGTTPTPRDPEAWAQLPEADRKAIFAGYQKLNQTAGVTPGLQLAPAGDATTVRVQDGRTVTTDGPSVGIQDALAGYLLFEADDLDAAIELAAQIPPARMGGAVEVRPVVER